jgi:hypothetical protein
MILTLPVILVLFAAIANRVDLREPLDKEKVRLAIQKEFPEKTIKRISLMQGGRVGDIGYYFVEFEPKGYRVVINDARFSLFDKTIKGNRYQEKGWNSNLTLVGHIWQYRTSPVRYRSTLRLKMKSLLDLIFNVKNKNQLFWDGF